MNRIIKKKCEFYFTLILSFSLVAYFWLVSRYPALHRKSNETSGGIKDVLTNWPSYSINQRDPLEIKIFYSTLNWIITNKQGMLFGVALAILIATLIEFVDLKRLEERFNSFWSGVLLGAPLGVCVNCVAPISYGLAKSKKNKLLLGTMFSSPTLNIVVLSMSFAIFPFYLVALKVFFTFIFIFILLPYLASKEPIASRFERIELSSESEVHEAGLWRLWSYLHLLLKQVFYVVTATVPFMFIAGLIGVVVAYFFPITSIGFSHSLGSFLLVNIVALLLPVPIIFDVILANTIYQLGAPVEMVAACLFSLGIFSIYASYVLERIFSLGFVLKLYVALFICSITVSFLSGVYHRSSVKQEIALFSKEFGGNTPGLDVGGNVEAWKLNQAVSGFSLNKVYANNLLEIRTYPFFPKKLEKNLFDKLEGFEIGLDRGFRMTPKDFVEPFFYGRGTASGDFNNDHWPDLVFGSERGMFLYKNLGGEFRLQLLNLGVYQNANIFNVALVDINNDGFLDLVASTYGKGNFYLLNKNGYFDKSTPTVLPNNKGIITLSMGFEDLNQDGLLDVFNGNETFGYLRFLHRKVAFENQRNSVLYNNFPAFREKVLLDYPGETLASLFSDIRNDGTRALYVANDYQAQDSFFDIGFEGQLDEKKPKQAPLPSFPFNAMSVDSGDLDNDLVPELFISASTNLDEDLLEEVPMDLRDKFKINEKYWQKNNPKICLDLKNGLDKIRCKETMEAFSKMNIFMGMRRESNISGCVKLRNSKNSYSRDCAMVEMLNLAVAESDPALCKNIGDEFTELKFLCQNYFKEEGLLNLEQDQILSTGSTNSIFSSELNDSGKFKTMGDKYKNFKFPKKSGWTWNSKIADFDNDGWQDIFMANGLIFEPQNGWNLFMKNYGEGVFKHEEEKFNLFDSFDIFSYTLIDYDQNGTLDIIANSSTGSVRVFKNNSANNAIAFELRDHKKNFFGIGARISIFYENKWQQIREVKASGGFMSFDHPQAYFGLNRVQSIDKVKVLWGDRLEIVINHRMLANQKYIIDRL